MEITTAGREFVGTAERMLNDVQFMLSNMRELAQRLLGENRKRRDNDLTALLRAADHPIIVSHETDDYRLTTGWPSCVRTGRTQCAKCT